MSLVEFFEKAFREYLAASGGKNGLRLKPGLTTEELQQFDARLPGKLPDEVRELLAFASGFEVEPIGLIDFLGRHPFAFEDAFPYGLPLAGDGTGNFWIQDLTDSGSWEQVLFVSHDPPVVALQAHSLEEFLTQILNATELSHPGALLQVMKDAVDRIWAKDPYLITAAEALSSDDRIISECAKQIDSGFNLADLRFADIGAGFSMRGLDTIVMRCGPQPIFAVKNSH